MHLNSLHAGYFLSSSAESKSTFFKAFFQEHYQSLKLYGS